jgi:hypothetical protein
MIDVDTKRCSVLIGVSSGGDKIGDFGSSNCSHCIKYKEGVGSKCPRLHSEPSGSVRLVTITCYVATGIKGRSQINNSKDAMSQIQFQARLYCRLCRFSFEIAHT